MAKTVLITGASSGFGRDTALLFKKKGWNVAATMRSPEKAKSWTGPAGLFTPRLDVTDRVSMQTAIDETVAKFGRIDVLINNAGFGLLGPLEGASPDRNDSTRPALDARVQERRDCQCVFDRRTDDSSAFLGVSRDEIRSGRSDRSLAV